MKLNVFRISRTELDGLKSKLKAVGMATLKEVDQAGWHGVFYFSKQPAPTRIPWVETFKNFFDEIDTPRNRNHFAVFLFTKGATSFALS